QSTDLRVLHRLTGLLRREIHNAASSFPSAGPDVPVLATAASGALTVDLLESDMGAAATLARQLGPFGYDIVGHRSPSTLIEAARRRLPSALILDVDSGSGLELGEIMDRLPDAVTAEVPMIFTAVREDLDARVGAVRAGAAAYLVKPVDVDDLAELLDRLTRKETEPPPRVLVVDDSDDTARLYAAALEEAGMLTRITTDPREVTRMIRDFGPEIILLDLYMPDIRGDELAQVIRQRPALQSIPIVFVSAETDERLQTRALGHGGDDFITKPVDLETLTSSVAIRAQRYRILRAAMQKDGLTGLLNHRNVKELLESEVDRAQRTGSPLSVAMLDIDRFKGVNDRYGHPVGDRVIKSLARILTQRLRRSDVIGRYGGEEFLLVMPDTPVVQAAAVVDGLRATFATLRHGSGSGSFECSFSAGVVEARDGEETGSQVVARADEALYRAKEGGRNRVVLG
ncbi:MAG: diguanylate cyclase, partial [Longimicrobiales bacterium]|nr:diguanylate cyclase [Longimicrobiales bacterium]